MFSQHILAFMAICFIPRAVSNPYKDVHTLLTAVEREKIFGNAEIRDVPDYSVTHPVQVDENGRFLSRDLSSGNHRRRRDIGSDTKEPLFIQMSAFGQNYHLNVTLNDEFLSPNFVIEIRGNDTSRFHFDVEHCHYTGHVLSTKGLDSKVAVSNCDGLSGLIRTSDESFMVNPLPDRLGLLKNNTRAHVIHRRSAPLENLGKRLNLEKRSANWCGVKDEPSSRMKREVLALDLPGVTDYDNAFTIETLVVADKKMTDFHGVEELKTYVPSLINIVYSLLGDSSIGATMKYVMHKLLILAHDQEGLVISSHAGNTMNSFCEWTKGQNVEDDNNPDHFDHAALISRFDFCRNVGNIKGQGCEKVLGLAQVQGMCSLTGSCTLSKDGGLGTAFTIAHETGHNLGAQHDSVGNPCSDVMNIMGTQASGKETAFEWSSCSRESIHSFLMGANSECLKDQPQKTVQLPQSLPGELYDGDDQCARAFGDGSRVCPAPFSKQKICTQLWCVKPDGMCSSHHEPAAEGTSCGPEMWCRRGACVPYGSEGPEAVDGGFSLWGEWSECSHSCGGGVTSRTRLCNNPEPKNGGKLCSGSSGEYKYCDTPKCPEGTPYPRAKQCETKRDMQFIDGNKYNWQYHPAVPSKAGQECKLSCIAEVGFRQFAKFDFGTVEDGARCDNFNENSGICIRGKCRTLGCDKLLGSTKLFDRCGVCDGDGTSCIGKRFTYKGTPKASKGHYQPIGMIPKGVRNIQIKEMSGFKNYLAQHHPDICTICFTTQSAHDCFINVPFSLAMMTTGGKDLLNMDFHIKPRSYTFVGAGTRFKYTRDALNRERITAPGPLTENVQLLYLVQDWKEEYQVRFRYLVQRPPEEESFDEELRSLDDEAVEFKWTKRSLGCSESCGGGSKIFRATCVRTDDESMVSDHFCNGESPGNEIQECNTQKCPARWKVGEWTDCSKACNDGAPGERTREVICIDESHDIAIDVGESSCSATKPHSRQTCAVHPCPAEWVTGKSSSCSVSCGSGVRRIEVKCVKSMKGRKYEVDDKECEGEKPPMEASCHTAVPCP